MNEQSGNSVQLQGDAMRAEFEAWQAALAARQPVGQEPVEYQYRFWLEDRCVWSGWAPVRKSDYERIVQTPEQVRQVRALYAAPPAPAAVPVDVYAAYKTWPSDIRVKLSLHDLRRMGGWAPKAPVADWRIDTSAGGPILVYKDCSVIEGEDARYVLGLIERDQRPVCCTADGKDWDGNPLTHPQPAAAKDGDA